MRSREVIQLIEADGWYEVEVKGSHHQFRHLGSRCPIPGAICREARFTASSSRRA
jgi:predicted RNA binding protein YcfA (HicA-like mRNA interferase family)